MPRPAILFLLNNLGVGGSERKTVNMAIRLTGRGWNVHLCCLGGDDHRLSTVSDRINVLPLGRRSRLDWRAIRRLGQYVSARAIDIVWSVNPYAMLYGSLALRGTGVRHYVSINTTYFPNRHERMQMLLYAPLLRRVDRLIFGSFHQKALWIRWFRLPEERSVAIHNGVDTEYFRPVGDDDGQGAALRRRLEIAPDEIVIAMVAQLRPEKSHETLIDAVGMLVAAGWPVRALLVGAGPKEPALRQRVAERGLSERVIFLGQTEDVRPALEACDIFALTSVAVETFSNAALEAMALEKPVVLSRLSGASEMLDEGEQGFLFEPGDVGDLVSKLKKLKDGAARRKMGNAARQRVCSEFSIERMITAYENMLSTCQGDKSPIFHSSQD